MQGYKYTTTEQAELALDQIDNFVNLPKGENMTQRWTSYQYAEFNNPNFYYIIAHDSFTALLGEPIELNLIEEIDQNY